MTAWLAFSGAPVFRPIGLVPPGTPSPKEAKSRRKRGRNWAATGFPKRGGGVRSVAMSVAAGGGVKSRVLIVHLGPPWQFWQPWRMKRTRPWATTAGELAPTVARRGVGPFGVRTA